MGDKRQMVGEHQWPLFQSLDVGGLVASSGFPGFSNQTNMTQFDFALILPVQTLRQVRPNRGKDEVR